MPQTIEAIQHAQAAEVPIIVAVNKIDKEGANPEKVKKELSNHNVIPEDWGGDSIFIDVSAKEGLGITELLEAISLQADVMELKGYAQGYANGIVIESRLEKGRGTVASILVQNGVLKKGDIVRRGMVIARTGATGAVFGDHLHFGVYVQGVAVEPIEWMDQHWINTNIVKVIKDARRMILK